MRSEYNKLKDGVSDGDVVTEGPSGSEKRRYVFFPLVRSGAIALCAIAIATAGVIGVVSNRPDTEFLGAVADLTQQGDSANPAGGTRQAAAIEGKEDTNSPVDALLKADAITAGESSAASESSAAAKADPAASAESASGTSNTTPASDEGNATGDAGNASVGGSSPSVGSESGHQHEWVAEMKTVDHAAEYKDVPHEAAYEKKKWTQCNACLDDITGNVAGHIAGHAAAGEPASYHTEESSICVKEAWVEKVLVKEAYSEEVPTGAEVCSCGACR